MWVVYVCLPECVCHIRRLLVVLLAAPILSKIGYNLTWQHGVVISWGGLRGAVGLALALVVVQEGNANEGTILSQIGNHVSLTDLLGLSNY